MSYINNSSLAEVTDTNELLRLLIIEVRKLNMMFSEANDVSIPDDDDIEVEELQGG